ncbi:MAG: DUF7793 family protein [Bacteroidia bacterium]
MDIKIIETDRYCIRLHKNENYMEFSIKENVIIDEHMILETKALVEAERPGEKFYILSEGTGFFNITNEARRLSATREFSGHMAAVAFYTTNESLRFLGNVYNNINQPAVPTKIFGDRNSAHDWLREQMEQK